MNENWRIYTLKEPLKTFKYQVAGHEVIQIMETSLKELLKNSLSHPLYSRKTYDPLQLLLKPTTSKEIEFYCQVNQNYPEWSQSWIPKFYGYYVLETNDLLYNGEKKWEYLLIMENLVPQNIPLVMMDLKIGKRLYDDEASDYKKEKMIRLAKSTSSWGLGFRIAGIAQFTSDGAIKWILDKEGGKKLTSFDSVSHHLCSHIRYKESFLNQVKKSIETMPSITLYSCSILVIESEKDLKIRWIDFVHSSVKESQQNAVDIRFALETIKKMIEL